MTCPACTLLQLLGEWVKLKVQILVRRVRVLWLTGQTQSDKEKLRTKQAEIHRHHVHMRNEEQRIERELSDASARLRS
jgi:hypothetical protein